MIDFFKKHISKENEEQQTTKKEDKYINELKYIKKQIIIKVKKYDMNSDYWYIH